MTVKEIIPLNTKKSKIVFDEGQVLALYKGEIRRFDISEGREVDEEEYYTVIYPVIKKRAFVRLMHIIESTFKSENDIVKKMRASYYPEEAIAEAVEKAKKFGYIDDDRYAERYINIYKDKYSRVKLRYKLMERGIDRDVIDAHLSEIRIDEKSMILKLLEKKHYGDTDEKDQKIIASVMRLGFRYQDIRDAAKAFSRGHDDS